jgi:psp operon transcriptional activator
VVQLAISSETPETPLGQAPAFRDMLAQVSLLAPLDRPALIVGERGTGKELVAGRLAYLSRRWQRPFIKLNCAALSESLLDSELFGHEAGAFTGAARRRAGRFELADGGTLFLDEIGTASLAVQEKLLRVIEYGAFDRVGGSDTLRVDVRVIAATNADLRQMARANGFRADLLDRLAFDVVAVPPLRQRREDIELLATHFARRMTGELGRTVFAGFTPAAIAQLLAHDWPGNVRELRNAVERSVYRTADPERPLAHIVIDPFPPVSPPAAAAEPEPPQPSGEDFITRTRAHAESLLRQALAEAGDNQRAAAKLLGLTYDQFRHQVKLHGLRPKRAD